MAEDDVPVKAADKEEKKKPAPKRQRKPKEKPAKDEPVPVAAAETKAEAHRKAVVSAQRVTHFISRGNTRAAISLLNEGRVEAAQLPGLFKAAIPLNNVLLLRAIVRAYGVMDVPCIQALGSADLVGAVRGAI